MSRLLKRILLCALVGPACVPAHAALEEVMVTATRSPAALVRWPGSVTRLGAASIALVGPTHAIEVVNRAAGAMIQRGSGQESLPALRSPVLSGAGACGAILVLEDGIPIRPTGTCNINQLFEVHYEQASAIEILRGPASALYGSSAVHGIINVIPALPAELPALALGLESGSDEFRRAQLIGSADAGSGRLGLTFVATDDGGWRDESGFREQKLGGAWSGPALAGQLVIRFAATRLRQETAGFIVGEDAWRDRALARSNQNPEAWRDADSARLSAHYRRDGFDARAYLRRSRMDFIQHFLLGKPLEDNGQDSGGLLLGWSWPAIGGGRLIAGTDVEFAASSLLQQQDRPTTGGSPAANAIRPAGKHYDYSVDSTLLAGYLQWQRPFGPHWQLEAGARLERVRYAYDNRMRSGNTDEAGVSCPGGCLYSRPEDRSDDFTNLAPRLGLTWQPNQRLAAWAALARGFRAPEITELYRLQRQQSVADLDAETVDAGELGLRWRSPALAADLATYRMDKRNVIVRDSAGFNVSGGRTRHRGIEYEFDWRLAGGWALAGSGTRAHHTYRFNAALEQGEQIVAGRDVDTAPRELQALRLRRDAGPLTGELEWLHVGGYWTNAANTAWYDGHQLLNLRLAWRPDPAWTLVLRVTNLADRRYADRADFAFGNHRYFPGRGRAAFVELDWRRPAVAGP
ncbi:MAG: TonB-dependent receptor [Gammaproteobacteria bacterium]|nr:TonB-dependent receptor [Gammaproteobacteria bacterium]